MIEDFDQYIDSLPPLTEEQLFPADDDGEPQIKERKAKK